MKKLIAAVAVALGVGAFASTAPAGGCDGPFCQGNQSLWGTFFHKSPMPAFQAAPWYLYWPYNAHFMTPAPLTGPYYAPPYSGGQLVNPYFPAAYQGAYPVAPVQPVAPPPAPTTTTVPPVNR